MSQSGCFGQPIRERSSIKILIRSLWKNGRESEGIDTYRSFRGLIRYGRLHCFVNATSVLRRSAEMFARDSKRSSAGNLPITMGATSKSSPTASRLEVVSGWPKKRFKPA